MCTASLGRVAGIEYLQEYVCIGKMFLLVTSIIFAETKTRTERKRKVTFDDSRPDFEPVDINKGSGDSKTSFLSLQFLFFYLGHPLTSLNLTSSLLFKLVFLPWIIKFHEGKGWSLPILDVYE